MSQGQGPNSNSLLTGPHNGQGAGGNVGQNQGQGVAGNNQVCLKEYYLFLWYHSLSYVRYCRVLLFHFLIPSSFFSTFLSFFFNFFIFNSHEKFILTSFKSKKLFLFVFIFIFIFENMWVICIIKIIYLITDYIFILYEKLFLPYSIFTKRISFVISFHLLPYDMLTLQ